jgi:hypothetical protein
MYANLFSANLGTRLLAALGGELSDERVLHELVTKYEEAVDKLRDTFDRINTKRDHLEACKRIMTSITP